MLKRAILKGDERRSVLTMINKNPVNIKVIVNLRITAIIVLKMLKGSIHYPFRNVTNWKGETK